MDAGSSRPALTRPTRDQNDLVRILYFGVNFQKYISCRLRRQRSGMFHSATPRQPPFFYSGASRGREARSLIAGRCRI
jgi:hypothetical protein